MLSDAEAELFRRPNVGHLATLKADGTPHSTPVWVDVEDGYVLVNTARGRLKAKHVERDPRVSLSIHDVDEPLSWVTMQGRVIEITEDGAVEHIHELAKKYTGKERWNIPPGQTRVILKIQPERVASRIL